jgi:hypothetical protein
MSRALNTPKPSPGGPKSGWTPPGSATARAQCSTRPDGGGPRWSGPTLSSSRTCSRCWSVSPRWRYPAGSTPVRAAPAGDDCPPIRRGLRGSSTGTRFAVIDIDRVGQGGYGRHLSGRPEPEHSDRRPRDAAATRAPSTAIVLIGNGLSAERALAQQLDPRIILIGEVVALDRGVRARRDLDRREKEGQ